MKTILIIANNNVSTETHMTLPMPLDCQEPMMLDSQEQELQVL
jgi:hypothetical protein